MSGFQKAKREQIYAKVALIGPSGSGKSYSALRLATGMIKDMNNNLEIYYIDTEGGRGKYYAEEFEYNYMEITEPYTTEKYIKAINDAVESGNCGVLIIDSTSHAWTGKGGILEQHSKMPGNSYTNWATLTPKYNRFVDSILTSKTHLIVTVRGKDEYVLEEKDGKKVPKKVGLGGEIRQNFEYEMTVAFNIDQASHVANATKDNTHIFEDRYDVLTEKDGEKLARWANSGVAAKPKTVVVLEDDTDKLQSVLKELSEYCTNATKVEKIITSTNLSEKIGELNNGVKNFMKNTDLDATLKLKDEIISYIEELKKA